MDFFKKKQLSNKMDITIVSEYGYVLRSYSTIANKKIDLCARDFKDSEGIALAFTKAVTASDEFRRKGNIKVGFIGEKNIGKSTFSNAFIGVISPSDDSYTQKDFQQFSYKSSEGRSIQRTDIWGAFNNFMGLGPIIRWNRRNCVHLIEHPNRNTRLKCDIIMAISRPKDYLPSPTYIFNDRENMNEEAGAPNGSRYLQIAFSSGYFDEEVFQDNIAHTNPHENIDFT